MLRLNFFWALGYFLGGYFGTQIAIPPSHASSIWPAAGIALVGMILHGNRIIPGLWLGALITQTYAFLDINHPQNMPAALVIGGISSIAATVQALFGAWLIKRYVGLRNALADDRSILRFFALGGPLSCTVSATVGVMMLNLKGIVTLKSFAFSWLTWWVGDVIGVLIFTPFLLCFMGMPRHKWRLRINSVALPLLVLSLLVALLFQLGRSQEQARISAIFEERTQLLHNALQNQIKRHIEANQTLKAFFDSSENVTPTDFKTFAQPLLGSYKALAALEWIPRITTDNPDFYQQQLGSGFIIRIPDAKGNMVAAPPRPEQFPIAYVEPYLGNERAFGFDVSSNPRAALALQQARETGKTTATKTIRLVQDPQQLPGIVIYSPVFSTKPDIGLRGYVASVLRVDVDVVAVKQQFDPFSILVTISDEGTELYHDTTDASGIAFGFSVLQKTLSLPLANRVWTVRYQAAPQFYQNQTSWYVWWLILGGFLLTGLTGIGLLMLTGRTMHTEGKVKLRTHELQKEIIRRKKIIRLHNDHNRVLQAIASPAPLTDILTLIVTITEQNYPNCLCSILLLNEAGTHLHLGVAPSLPDIYNQAIDGLPIGDGIGSCGTAAYTKQRVIIEDVLHHPYCRDFVGLAKATNLAACLSEPIFSSEQTVLGTMAVYHRKPYYPHAELLSEINELAQLASIAIERRRSEEKVTQLAFFDALTNLPNRRLFMTNLEKNLSSEIRHKTNGALIYMDLDHFKALNDSLGHDIGDELLIQVANRLLQCVRDEDTVARLGGDEFVILLSCRESSRDAMMENALTTAERVQTALQAPYRLKEHIHYITPSIGITLIPHPDVTSIELLKQADTAMYHAKNKGRNAISFYSLAMQQHADQRLRLERELRLALAEQQFSLYYQAQFDTQHQLIGAEALLRWWHPEAGMTSSGDFISVAEETGLILLIGDWVLREACAQLVRWPNLPHLAINISNKQFRQPNFCQKIAAALAEHQLSEPRLTLEITEACLRGDLDETIEKLQALQNLGVEISIDDFGTGHSSLAYLKRLPINQLKIDQCFVHAIATDSNDAVIAKIIIAMTRHFGLSVIAEGVETAEQLAFLHDSACNGYQGYYFSSPINAEEFTHKHPSISDFS